GYAPYRIYETNERLRRVLDFIRGGSLCPTEPGLFDPLVDDLLHHDRFMLLADFDSYLAAQDQVDTAFRDPDAWTRTAILNVARCGYFSADRAVREYAEKVWKL